MLRSPYVALVFAASNFSLCIVIQGKMQSVPQGQRNLGLNMINYFLLTIIVFAQSSFKEINFMQLIVIVSQCYKYVNTSKNVVAERSSEAISGKLWVKPIPVVPVKNSIPFSKKLFCASANIRHNMPLNLMPPD